MNASGADSHVRPSFDILLLASCLVAGDLDVSIYVTNVRNWVSLYRVHHDVSTVVSRQTEIEIPSILHVSSTEDTNCNLGVAVCSLSSRDGSTANLSFEAQTENGKAKRVHKCSLHIEDPPHSRKAEEASSGPPTLCALTSQNALNADSYVLSQGGMLLRVSWLRTVVITNSGFF